MNYNSKEFYINMKEKDIPKWDPLYTYDEQDDDVKQFWDNEALKLTEGVTINGVYIHPWLYWHLNFWHMMLDKGMDRVPGLSSLRDNEWFFAEMLQKAEEQNKAIFMFGTRRFGKALLNSEILYMEQGEKTIGEALVGDKIYDDAGNLTEITGVYPQGRVMTYKVTFEDGRNCICCGDHLWRVKRLGSWKVLSLKSLIASNYKECSIQLCEAIDYPDAKLPIAPNAYGAMMAAYLSGDSNDIVLNKSMNRLYIRSSRRQKKIFVESFIKYMGSIVTSNEKFYIKNIDYTILHFVKQMFWSCGWYASFNDGFLTLSSTKKEIAITSIEIYGNHEATCITVSNQSRLFLTTNYIVTHNSAIMSSFLARNATMTYNLTHNVICASADDLLTLTEYLEFGLDNMHPFLKINRTGNNWDKEVVLGTRNIRNERDVHARIRITNIDQGKTAASLKTAGGTPFTSIYDEVGKFPFLNAYLAGKPAHMANGRMRGMILAAGCCCAGTVVYKANGEPCLIENLKQEDGIIGFDVNNSVVSKEHITWMKPPSYKDCYRITTNRGRILECSGDHPILTVISKRRGEFRYYGADFRRMDSLRVGRKICISDSVDIWGEDSMDDPYFIGMLIGNGTYGFDKTPVLATSDDEVYDYVNSRYDCVIEREYKTKKGKNYKEIRIKGICKMLRNLGIYGQTGKNKTLPNNIHRYKRSDIISFIMGYFDADSYFYEKKKKTNNNISIYSCNKTILEEVRVLLYKLGIISHICKEFSKHPSNRNVLLEGYKLVIRDKVSLLNYCNIIGSKIKYRLDVLNGIRKQVELFNTKGSIRTKYIDGVILEVVKKIEYIGSRQVYNLTASNTHTYLANGIITHNTGGNVEKSQDAQKVMNNPSSYGFMVMDYDLLNKRCITPTWRICKSGCFVPGQMSHAYPKDKTTLDKYLGKENSPMLKKIPISVTNYERSTAKIKEDLEGFSKSDKELFIQTKMAYPLTIDDCFLNAAVNRFPIEDATIHKNRLLEQGRPGQLVDVFQLEGKKMGWKPSDKMLAPYPFKGGNIDCPVVMYEEPPKEGGNFDDYVYVSGCLPPGEVILTDNGWKPVEEVGLNDRLVDREGNYVKIHELMNFDKDNTPLYSIGLKGTYRNTRVTEEHPVYVSDDISIHGYALDEKRFNFRYLEAKDVKPKMWTMFPNIYTKVSMDESKMGGFKNSIELWWLIGLWYGDGYICENTITYCINSKEDYVIERIKKSVGILFGEKSVNLRRRTGCFEVSFNDKVFSDWINSNFGKYADGKYIPEWVKYLPKEYKLSLIQGYLDSDGSVTIHTKGYVYMEFVSINLALLEDIQHILFSLGIIGCITMLRDRKERFLPGAKKISITKPCYHLRIGNYYSIMFRDMVAGLSENYIYGKLSKIGLGGKKPKRKNVGMFFSKDNSKIFIQIDKVEMSLYSGKVYNYHCENNNYCCKNINLHNCDPYKQDKANTESLGALYILKRYVTINDPFAYRIAASYVSRPPKSDDFCRNCEILIEGYGAKCLMENADRMFELYLARRNKEMLLLEDGEKVASKIIRPGARQNNRLGLSPTVPNQRMLYNAVLQYCWEEVVVGFDEDGNEIKQKGIYRIDDIELLEEMIAFGPGVNTDRIVAFGHALLLAKYYDDMNFMPKSTTEKMNQEKIAVRKLNQYKGFVLRRHNPFKLRR